MSFKHTVCFDQIYLPFPLQLSNPPTTFTSQYHWIFFQLHCVHMCMHTHCLHVHGCSTIPSSMGSCLGAVSRRKLTLFHFQQLSVAKSSSVWWDSLSSSPTNAVFRWLDLVQVSCVQSQALWVHVCNSPIRSSRSFHCRHSWPLSTPCLKWSLSLVEIERDIDLLFRDEPYTVFCCLHTD